MARNKKYNGSGNPRGPGIEANGRSKEKGVWLPFWLINSPAYFDLIPTAQALLIRIGAIAYGANNGRWFMSVRDAASLLGVADKTAATALQDLINHGFLVVVQEATFELKTAAMAKTRARVWRATWLPVRNYRNQRGSAPTSEFSNWRATTPDEHRRVNRAIEVIGRWTSAKQIAEADSTEVPTIDDNCNPVTSADSTEVNNRNVTIVRKTTSVESTTHSVLTRGKDSGASRATASQCIRARNVSMLWLSAGIGRTQKQLAIAAGIDPAKFSRFLADKSGRKTLTENQARALFRTTDQPESIPQTTRRQASAA